MRAVNQRLEEQSSSAYTQLLAINYAHGFFFSRRISADRALRHKLCTVLHLYHQAFMIVTYFFYINDIYIFSKIKNQARHVYAFNHQVLETVAEMLKNELMLL